MSTKKNWKYLWEKSLKMQMQNSMKFNVATVTPGYNDSHLLDEKRLGNKFRKVSRDNLETYKATWDFVLKNIKNIDFINISTFNEFHEETHIEPTIDFGDIYIKETKKYISKIKND